MYSTCIHCHKPLGSNAVFETFPVGERLAFDPAQGRLWVVCTHCEQWNLSPFEERLEAIEKAERLYQAAPKHVGSKNMGLARLRGGTTILRIGEPRRAEFAAWRYGDQFGRRRRVQWIIAIGGIALLAAWVVGVAAAGWAIGAFVLVGEILLRPVVQGRWWGTVARVPTHDGRVLHVRRRHLRQTTVGRSTDGRMLLHLRHTHGEEDFEGREAERVAAIVVPKVNRYGGDKDEIRRAVAAIEEFGGSEEYFDEAVKFAAMYTKPFGLFSLPPEYSLALEMVLHEQAERQAMHGELTELADTWREAETIAATSDSMFIPAAIAESFRELKARIS